MGVSCVGFCVLGAVAVAFGTGEGLLVYGICVRCKKRAPGVREAFSKALGAKNRPLVYRMGARYRRRASGVREAVHRRHSVQKTGFSGTEGIFGVQKGLLWYAKRFLRHSATKKGSWGTRCIFKGPLNSLLLHRMRFQRRAEQPTPQTVNSCYTERILEGAKNNLRSEVSKYKKRMTSKSIKTF